MDVIISLQMGRQIFREGWVCWKRSSQVQDGAELWQPQPQLNSVIRKTSVFPWHLPQLQVYKCLWFVLLLYQTDSACSFLIFYSYHAGPANFVLIELTYRGGRANWKKKINPECSYHLYLIRKEIHCLGVLNSMIIHSLVSGHQIQLYFSS